MQARQTLQTDSQEIREMIIDWVEAHPQIPPDPTLPGTQQSPDALLSVRRHDISLADRALGRCARAEPALPSWGHFRGLDTNDVFIYS